MKLVITTSLLLALLTLSEAASTTVSDVSAVPTPCRYDGETYAYPGGKCHLYYMCLPDGNGSYEIELFDCGNLIYDPAEGSCVFPTDSTNDLCET